MTKAILTTKSDSGYDDVREERYHFPVRYFTRMKDVVGDLAIYYEPRRGDGRSAYVAVAQVDSIDEDRVTPNHYYARISNYVSFDCPVPFRDGGELYERILRGGGTTGLSGEFRNAVRLIPDHEFEMILAVGFSHLNFDQPRNTNAPEFAEETNEFHRPIVEQVLRRPFRDAAFSRQVKAAYAYRCAFTGLDMRNGGGRPEVDAAHIKPVGDGHNGSDSIRNGIALSKTVHWMFDRGLIAVDSDCKILTAGSLVPEPIKRLLNPSGEVCIPMRSLDQPHPAFLHYHRNNIFKGARP